MDSLEGGRTISGKGKRPPTLQLNEFIGIHKGQIPKEHLGADTLEKKDDEIDTFCAGDLQADEGFWTTFLEDLNARALVAPETQLQTEEHSIWSLTVRLGTEREVLDQIQRRLLDPRCPFRGLRLPYPLQELPARVFVEVMGPAPTPYQRAFLESMTSLPNQPVASVGRDTYKAAADQVRRISEIKLHDWVQILKGPHQGCTALISAVRRTPNAGANLYDALVLQPTPGVNEQVEQDLIVLEAKDSEWFGPTPIAPTPRELEGLERFPGLPSHILANAPFHTSTSWLRLGDRVLVTTGMFEGHRAVVSAILEEEVQVSFLLFHLETNLPLVQIRLDFLFGTHVRVMDGPSQGSIGWIIGFEPDGIAISNALVTSVFKVDPCSLAFDEPLRWTKPPSPTLSDRANGVGTRGHDSIAPKTQTEIHVSANENGNEEAFTSENSVNWRRGPTDEPPQGLWMSPLAASLPPQAQKASLPEAESGTLEVAIACGLELDVSLGSQSLASYSPQGPSRCPTSNGCTFMDRLLRSLGQISIPDNRRACLRIFGATGHPTLGRYENEVVYFEKIDLNNPTSVIVSLRRGKVDIGGVPIENLRPVHPDTKHQLVILFDEDGSKGLFKVMSMEDDTCSLSPFSQGKRSVPPLRRISRPVESLIMVQ